MIGKKTTNNLPCESLIEFYKYISFCTTCYCWKSLCFFANSFWFVRTLNHLYSNAIWFGNESFFLLCRKKLLLKEDLKWKPIDRIYFWFIWSFSHHLTMWFISTFFLSFVDIYYTKWNAAKNYSDWYTHSGFQGIHTYEEKYGNDFWAHLLCICGEHSLVLLFQIKYILFVFRMCVCILIDTFLSIHNTNMSNEHGSGDNFTMKTSKKEKNQEQSMYSVLCSTHLCSHYWTTRQAFGQDKTKQKERRKKHDEWKWKFFGQH